MSTLSNILKCRDCDAGKNWEFSIELEWLGPKEAMEEIKKIKCPKCGGENWYFTDACEH